MKKITEGKRVLEWAGEFAAQDFKNMSKLEILNSFDSLINIGIHGDWNANIARILDWIDSKENEAESLEEAREDLQQKAEKIKEFFKLMFNLKKFPALQLETYTRRVIFRGENSELGVMDWNDNFTLEAFVGDEKSPTVLQLGEKVKFPSFIISLYNALPDSNISGFRQCPECGRYFYHWRKRERTFCSRTCKGRAAAKKLNT